MLADAVGYGRLARWFGIALVAATLANGAGFYLKRTGLIDQDAYRAYWKFHCTRLEVPRRVDMEVPSCATYSAAMTAPAQAWPLTPSDKEAAAYIYDTPAREVALKIFKDALGAALIAVSCGMIVRRGSALPGLREAWPIYLLAGYILVAFACGPYSSGALTAAARLRPFVFLFIALLCRWLLPRLTVIAGCMALLLGAEALLVPYEVLSGLHLNGHIGLLPLAARSAGTLVKPNSMGIFAVTALAFYYCYSQNRRYLTPVGLTSLALVLASSSGTGFVCTGLFWYAVAREHVGDKRRIWVIYVGLALIVALLFTLPALLGRPYVTASIFERWEGVEAMWSEKSVWQLALGSGLGTNTNVVLNLAHSAAGTARQSAHAVAHVSDSTLISLLEQMGVAGILLFYGMLYWAVQKDRGARIFFVVVGLCSMTINLPELFPVNYLFGLGLAGSAWAANRAAAHPA